MSIFSTVSIALAILIIFRVSNHLRRVIMTRVFVIMLSASRDQYGPNWVSKLSLSLLGHLSKHVVDSL